MYVGLFAAVYARYSNLSPEHTNFGTAQYFFLHVRAFTPLIFLWLLVFYIHNLYEITSAKNNLEFYNALGRSLVFSFLTPVLFFYFADFEDVAPKTNLFIYFVVFTAFFILWRGQINRLLKRNFLTSTAIIAENENGYKLAIRLNQNPQIGYRVGWFIGPKPSQETKSVFSPEIIDSSAKKIKLSDFIREHKLKAVIIDDKALRKESVVTSLYDFVDNVEMYGLDKFNERVWRKVNLASINQLWFVNNFASGRKNLYEGLKRILDFLVSLFFLPLGLFLGIFIALLVKLEDGGPVFYYQKRVGQKGRLFVLPKFRTMCVDAESKGAQLTAKNDKRVTRIGRFLRKTRLDEIPQLRNILTGEMSFVGPRAERPEFHDLLIKEIPFYDRRYLVKPGLTGWAQINYYGFNLDDTREKLAYDFYYLKNRSLVFDIGIILKTINIVLSGLGH